MNRPSHPCSAVGKPPRPLVAAAAEILCQSAMPHPPAARLRDLIARRTDLHANICFDFIVRGEAGDSPFSASEIGDDVGGFQVQPIKDREIRVIGQVSIEIGIRMQAGGSARVFILKYVSPRLERLCK